VFAVSDRTAQLNRGDGGGVQSQRHAPAEADEWAFLNTKLTNEAITQQARPPARILHHTHAYSMTHLLGSGSRAPCRLSSVRVGLAASYWVHQPPICFAAGPGGGAHGRGAARAAVRGAGAPAGRHRGETVCQDRAAGAAAGAVYAVGMRSR
jgi:hypothetical protein